jgi:dipeptidyl aminopeptidase/acylaminoacyl peptidase
MYDPDATDPIHEATEALADGGRRVRLELFHPARDGTFPAVGLLHGADGLRRRGADYRAAARALAQAGYLVGLPHYLERTGTPEGAWPLDPFKAVQWLGAVEEAVGHLAAHPRSAGRRVGLVGFSLGAYLALTAATQDRRIAAVADVCGGFPPFVDRAAALLPPTLILHGLLDTVVPASEAFRLEGLLRARSRHYEIHTYPDEGHVLSPGATADALHRAARFLGEHLQ